MEITQMGLPTRVENALINDGLKTDADIHARGRRKMLLIPFFGRWGLRHLEDVIGTVGGNTPPRVLRHNEMTLRDYFAGKALEGYFANPSTPHQNACGEDEMAYMYETADAMLKAREL